LRELAPKNISLQTRTTDLSPSKHPVSGLEEHSRRSNDLTIRRVIRTFDADDTRNIRVMVAFHVFGEFILGSAGANEEPFRSWLQRLYDAMQKGRVCLNTSATKRPGMFVGLVKMLSGRKLDLLRVFAIEEKYLGFPMVKPDNSVLGFHGYRLRKLRTSQSVMPTGIA
jgi:hypothetical protein